MRTKRVKHIVDILLGIGLILLMSYQVVGEEGHEWTGIAMTALMLIHQVLNRKWYAALFKGKYAPLRIVQTVINLTLLGCFLLTAMSGINMGVYAIPSLAEFMKASTGRRMHLALSHWSFILMGLHLGLHVPAMLKGLKNRTSRRIGCCLSFPAAGAGLYFFLKNSFPDYLSFQRHFAFIDYEKPAVLVLLEALLIASFFAFVGFQLQKLLVRGKKGKGLAVLGIALAVAIGIALNVVFPAPAGDSWSGEESPWGGEAAFTGADEPDDTEASDTSSVTEAPNQEESEEIPVDDGFVWIEGGSFLMGSPETENWRIDDETQHEVTVSGFWMSPFEVTQAEYETLMGVNPSQFSGENLPVENVTWLDAVRFCNLKSQQAGLTPVYTIDGATVAWDRGADGYRLPTEAEWEYACRAGTTTPFNTIHANALRTTRRASPSPASCQPLSCRVQERALTTEPALRRPSIRHTFPV